MELEYTTLDRYAFSDPAGGVSRVKKIRARQAIVCASTDWLQRVFVHYAWAGRLPTSKYKDKILEVYEEHQPRVFGIEANAMQKLFGDLVRDEAKRKFGQARFIGVSQPTRLEKDFRIRTTLEPVIFSGRLFIAGKTNIDGQLIGVNVMMQELMNELRGFPTAKTKDLVDALASVIALMPKRMYEKQRSDEMDSLAAYLRSTNMPPHLIEQRLEEVRAEVEVSGRNVTVH